MRLRLLMLFLMVGPITALAFPEPSGKHLVGQLSFTFERPLSGSETRQLNTWVFVPAKKVQPKSKRKYLSDEKLLAAMKELKYLRFSEDTLEGWTQIGTHSYSKSTPADQRFPIVFILHGRGSSKLLYTSLAEEISSHGYVVVVADHPNSGLTIMKDGSVRGLADPADLVKEVNDMSADVCFLVNELSKDKTLSKLIDPQKMGMIGHSLGSIGVFNIALNNCGFTALINFDGYPYGEAVAKGVSIPHLSIWGELPTHLPVSVDTLAARRYRTWNSFLKISNKDFVLLKAKGMYHTDFNDMMFLRSETFRMRNPGAIEAQRGYNIVRDVTMGYLNYRLKNGSREDFMRLIGDIPEISMPIKAD